MTQPGRPGLVVTAPDGVPEIGPGDDLAALLAGCTTLEDGDIVVVTSKVVSKAEGRLRPGTREEALPDEMQRVVARRGATTIARTHHGLILAAAGIDASNVEAGTVVLLPLDPDDSARRLRTQLLEGTGRNVGVIITDTAGRAWREGQTDIAIGAAGLVVLEEFAGRYDAHGNLLAVTAPAVADELASAAELAQGKLGARPFAVVRGRSDLVLAAGDDGTGARILIRAEGADLFGWGAREAVVRALRGDAGDRRPFGAVATTEEFAEALESVLLDEVRRVAGGLAITVADDARAVLAALAFAHGWDVIGPVDPGDPASGVRLEPGAP